MLPVRCVLSKQHSVLCTSDLVSTAVCCVVRGGQKTHYNRWPGARAILDHILQPWEGQMARLQTCALSKVAQPLQGAAEV